MSDSFPFECGLWIASLTEWNTVPNDTRLESQVLIQHWFSTSLWHNPCERTAAAARQPSLWKNHNILLESGQLIRIASMSYACKTLSAGNLRKVNCLRDRFQ